MAINSIGAAAYARTETILSRSPKKADAASLEKTNLQTSAEAKESAKNAADTLIISGKTNASSSALAVRASGLFEAAITDEERATLKELFARYEKNQEEAVPAIKLGTRVDVRA